MKNIFDFTFEELAEIVKKFNEPDYRTVQLFGNFHKRLLYKNFNDLKNIPAALIKKLEEKFYLPKFELLNKEISNKDSTVKFLFLTDKKNKIETVLISEKDRNTICISTQAGCNVGCEFCATGKIGFQKNLTLSEIILQVYEVMQIAKITPTNIVYMGMGEPFLNYENVIRSLRTLTDEKGLNIPSKRITVSTVGFKNKIKKFADDLTSQNNSQIRKVKLALSLHTTDKGLREKLIPTSKINKLPAIYEELIYFYKKTKSKITYEYIYFENLNDTQNDVKRLVKLSKMLPCNINIIPFHRIGYHLNPPLEKFNEIQSIKNSLSNINLNDFIARLKSERVTVNLRTSSGEDISAACGQLAGKNSQKIIN